ncbi:alpha/beta fold hydrolase [Sulfurospirillum arcachonense]|uniref:alpha/beta fold hydrolase n=1 Tax=Sulfurospirillum arcachonense TaxID=57666 RepID=UPI00046A0426|nr:alpha/beta fold hydrolase [Sulfurospirillum arcachonense]
MNTGAYNLMKYVLDIVEKITDANITIKGLEKIPTKHPILFVANHFTRMETFIIPYILYKKMDIAVRAVADDSLFISYFGAFLDKMGIVPVGHKDRNSIIISDLLSGKNNWLIFPEGNMVKNKRIIKRHGHYFSKNSKDIITRVHSGAAFFALQAQTIRDEFQNAPESEKEKIKEKYNIEDDILLRDVVIVPLNISYIPLHPKENFIAKTARQFVADMSPRIMEELKVEGELLLDSQMIINVGKPEFMEPHVLGNGGEIQKCTRVDITDKIMHQVYKNITFQFDHFFALILETFPHETIRRTHLTRLLYSLIDKLKHLDYHFDENLLCGYLNLIADEIYQPFEDAVELALNQKVISEIKTKNFDGYKINKNELNNLGDFHMIRLDNTFKVLINELQLYDTFRKEAQPYIEKDESTLSNELFMHMIKDEEIRFEMDYEKFKNSEGVKDKDVGKPYFLDACKSGFCGNRIGVVFSHGYSSSPAEVREASEFLQNYGIDVYALRLNGHGTAPENMKECDWEDWYGAFSKAYAILSLRCEHIFLTGFSTGGLLALLAASRKKSKIDGVICINAALKLNDIRMNYILPAVTFWNDLVSGVLQKEFVENKPAYPKFNYEKYYLKSIKELNKLMDITNDDLPKIKLPALIIQATHDPVVNPDAAQTILSDINSSYKSLIYLDLDKHVIVQGEGKELLFNEILSFIKKNRDIVDWNNSIKQSK